MSRQVPITHVWNAPHETSHAPQLSSLVIRSWQLRWQHVIPAAHRTPHAPQLFSSKYRSRHTSPHASSMPAQVTLHVPVVHSPLRHRRPHVPQCIGSSVVSAQVPVQHE